MKRGPPGGRRRRQRRPPRQIALAVLLVGDEEECPVAPVDDGAPALAEAGQVERPAEGAREDVLDAERKAVLLNGGLERLGTGCGVVDARIQYVGERPVELVGARLGDGVDDAAAGAAELGVVVRGLDGDLLDGVGVGDLEALAGHRDVVVLGAVDQEVVRPAARAVNHEGADANAGAIARDARKRQGERRRVATREGQIRHLARRDVAAAYGGLGLQERAGLGRHIDGDLLAADRQLRVHGRGLAGVDDDVGLDQLAEARCIDRHGVIAEVNGVEAVEAFVVGGRRAGGGCLCVKERDIRAGDGRPVRVFDDAAHRAAAGLRESRRREKA